MLIHIGHNMHRHLGKSGGMILHRSEICVAPLSGDVLRQPRRRAIAARADSWGPTPTAARSARAGRGGLHQSGCTNHQIRDPGAHLRTGSRRVPLRTSGRGITPCRLSRSEPLGRPPAHTPTLHRVRSLLGPRVAKGPDRRMLDVQPEPRAVRAQRHHSGHRHQRDADRDRVSEGARLQGRAPSSRPERQKGGMQTCWGGGASGSVCACW